MRYLFLCLLLMLFISIMLNKFALIHVLINLFKKCKAVHWAWIILFFAIVNLGKIESENIIVSNSFQLALVPISGIIIFISFFGRIQSAVSNITMAAFSLMLYALFGIISGLYSPFPEFSIYKATLIFLPLIIGLVVPSYSQPFESVKTLIYLTYSFFVILLFSFILGGIINPQLALVERPGMVLGMLQGWIIITNPNTVGLVSGALLLVMINRSLDTRSMKEKFTYFCMGIAAFAGVVLGQSRTCVAAFAISLVLLLYLRKKFAYLMLVLILGLSILAVEGLREDVWMYAKRGLPEEKIETWSGRIPAWKYSWERFKERPILGYGMAAGVRFGAVSKGLVGSHLHSSYFEVLLNSGLLGFIPWFICLFMVGKTLIYRALAPPKWFTLKDKHFHLEMTILFFYFLIRSITGTTFVYVDNTFLIYISLLAYTIFLNKKSGSFQTGRIS